MYHLPHFTTSDIHEIIHFMKEHPFASLIGAQNDIPTATQIPFLIEENGAAIKLKAHVMRHTDHYQTFVKNKKVLVLFQGPHCYVSASWYKERGHASTWNYMTVQAEGAISFYEEDEKTIELIKELTHHFEDKQTKPELVEDMSEDYIKENVKAIAGFEITVDNLKATFKLSQNQDNESYENIICHLSSSGNAHEQMIAAQMRMRR